MGLWARIRRLFTGNINALLDKAEDPELTLKQTIHDMKEEYGKTKSNVAEAVVHLKKLERDEDKHRKLADKYHAKAKQILSDGDETNDHFAKEALMRKKENLQLAEQYASAADRQRAAVDQLKKNLQRMESKIRDAERRKDMLTSQLKIAETRQKLADATTNAQMPSNEAFQAFERVQDKIEDMTVRAEVAEEMAAPAQDKQLMLEEIEDVTFGADIDQEYEQLKLELLEGPDDQTEA